MPRSSAAGYLRPDKYLRWWARQPRKVWRTHSAALKHPLAAGMVWLQVEGLVSPFVLALLYDSVMNCKATSNNVLEFGSYKGLSACCLSRAAARKSKRLLSFEWFEGIPEVEGELEAAIPAGSFSSDEGTWRTNVEHHGVPSVCTLVKGDARETVMGSRELHDEGFCVAFLDIDTYDVTSKVMKELATVVRGGEIVVMHDSFLPGVVKSVEEFRAAIGRDSKVIDYEGEALTVHVA